MSFSSCSEGDIITRAYCILQRMRNKNLNFKFESQKKEQIPKMSDQISQMRIEKSHLRFLVIVWNESQKWQLANLKLLIILKNYNWIIWWILSSSHLRMKLALNLWEKFPSLSGTFCSNQKWEYKVIIHSFISILFSIIFLLHLILLTDRLTHEIHLFAYLKRFF